VLTLAHAMSFVANHAGLKAEIDGTKLTVSGHVVCPNCLDSIWVVRDYPQYLKALSTRAYLDSHGNVSLEAFANARKREVRATLARRILFCPAVTARKE
jgi:hypothetical protein